MTVSAHAATLVDLAAAWRWRCGAELGFGEGETARELLGCAGMTLISVESRAGRARQAVELSREHSGRLVVLHTTTDAAAAVVANESLDFVFVDADHHYEAVRSDIEHWWPKVRPGGWFGGHDYHEKFRGVIRAVDESFGDSAVRFPGFVWGLQK